MPTILTVCGTETEVVKRLCRTLIHEAAHHLGIDDHELEERGRA